MIGGMVVLAVGGLVGFVAHRERQFFVKYQSIQVGMTRAEVEAILGPGEEVEQKSVPSHVVPINAGDEIALYERAKKTGTIPTARNYPVRHKPIVEGDLIFQWQRDGHMQTIYISFIDGCVVEKDFDDPYPLFF